MKLKEGDLAPNFELLDDEFQPRRLTEFAGRKLVLYFYPKDDTTGCTAEACSFRDNYAVFEKQGIQVIGISADSTKSHDSFKQKYGLPFVLLSDPEHKVCEAYGVWGTKKMYGREYQGILRTTFLIDEVGKIMKIYEQVKPTNHAQEILQEFGQS